MTIHITVQQYQNKSIKNTKYNWVIQRISFSMKRKASFYFTTYVELIIQSAEGHKKVVLQVLMVIWIVFLNNATNQTMKHKIYEEP